MVETAPDAPRDGRSTRWDPHRKQRRLDIIAAAVAAIESDGPDARTGRIAELAGVPRTHVYRHFDGKRALDLAVSAHLGNDLGRRIRAGLATGGTARALIHAAVDEHLRWIEEHPNLYRFLAQHAYAVRAEGSASGADDAKARFAAELSALVDRYLRVLGADAASADRIIVGVVGLVDATAAWWLDARDPVPERTVLTDELTRRVWLLLDDAGRSFGLQLDPDRPLPELG